VAVPDRFIQSWTQNHSPLGCPLSSPCLTSTTFSTSQHKKGRGFSRFFVENWNYNAPRILLPVFGYFKYMRKGIAGAK
jgi:hypothetical protein